MFTLFHRSAWNLAGESASLSYQFHCIMSPLEGDKSQIWSNFYLRGSNTDQGRIWHSDKSKPALHIALTDGQRGWALNEAAVRPSVCPMPSIKNDAFLNYWYLLNQAKYSHGYYKTWIGTHRLPIICCGRQYRLITGKDQNGHRHTLNVR